MGTFSGYWHNELEVKPNYLAGGRTILRVIHKGELIKSDAGIYADVSLTKENVIELVRELCAAYHLTVRRELPEPKPEYVVMEVSEWSL